MEAGLGVHRRRFMHCHNHRRVQSAASVCDRRPRARGLSGVCRAPSDRKPGDRSMFHPTATARVLALVVAALAASQTSCAENLLQNPGAEQGKGENLWLWERASVAADGLKMERTSEIVKGGTASLIIANDPKYDKPIANNWMQSLQ